MKYLALVLLLLSVLTSQAQKRKNKSKDIHSKHVQLNTGDVHKMLSTFVGIWDEEITTWSSLDQAETKGKGKVVIQMVLNGRYQHARHLCEFMGADFEGFSIIGFDNVKQVFQTTWIDNMSTGILFMDGSWNEAAKKISFKGKFANPSNGELVKVLEEYTFSDLDNIKIEMYITTSKQAEMKSMEMNLKRVQRGLPKK
jgi:hypothetical protein